MTFFRVVLLIFTFFIPVYTGHAGIKLKIDDDRYMEVFLMGQIWGVYSTDLSIPGENSLKKRVDGYIRRGRFGFRGRLTGDISYKIWFAYDNVGKDSYNPADVARGSIKNEGSYSKIELWDAFFTWHIDRHLANITFGYFRPQIGRENITSGFAVLSFEKGLPNFYVRRHIIGKPDSDSGFSSTNGRIYLINWGGLLNREGWSLNWNAGIGDNQNYTDASNWSPFFSFRTVFSFGQPELKRYSLGYTQTFFGRRKGVSLGLNYAYQGEGVEKTISGQPKFSNNRMFGVDILGSYRNIEIVGEYDILRRKWSDGRRYTDRVWEVKIGYSIQLQNGRVIQPSFSYSRFRPDSNGNSIFGRKENVWWDAGINYYINGQKAKITLHYASGKVYNYTNPETADTGTVKSSYIGIGFQFRI
ncbi:porin [Persephonella sp.]